MMRIELKGGTVPEDFYDQSPVWGKEVIRPKSHFGVTAKLIKPDPAYKGWFYSDAGSLNANCTPWDFAVRRKEFIAFCEENDIEIAEVSSVEVSLSHSHYGRGLKPVAFCSDELDVTIVFVGDDKVKITTMCRGDDPLALHIQIWNDIINGRWKSPK